MRKLIRTLGRCTLLAALVATAQARDVWIDTDLSLGSPLREVDDAYALLVAVRSLELRIAGISTTYGNAPLHSVTERTRKSLGAFGVDLKVNPGAASARDLGRATAASDALAVALRRQKLTYLALGPLTNVATFLQLHPEATKRFEQIIVAAGTDPRAMTGSGPGGKLRLGDANLIKDPAAEKVLLRSRVPLLFVPVTTSARLLITPADLRAMEMSALAARYVARRSRIWLWFWTRFVRAQGGPIFDAVAVVAAARPELLTIEKRELDGREVEVCTGFTPATKQLVLRRLTGRAEKSSPSPRAR